jgi:hypothetical protein
LWLLKAIEVRVQRLHIDRQVRHALSAPSSSTRSADRTGGLPPAVATGLTVPTTLLTWTKQKRLCALRSQHLLQLGRGRASRCRYDRHMSARVKPSWSRRIYQGTMLAVVLHGSVISTSSPASDWPGPSCRPPG